MTGLLLARKCDNCGGIEERTFTDSWTGKDLCLMCLSAISDQITMSPASEGDNLQALLDITTGEDNESVITEAR